MGLPLVGKGRIVDGFAPYPHRLRNREKDWNDKPRPIEIAAALGIRGPGTTIPKLNVRDNGAASCDGLTAETLDCGFGGLTARRKIERSLVDFYFSE